MHSRLEIELVPRLFRLFFAAIVCRFFQGPLHRSEAFMEISSEVAEDLADSVAGKFKGKKDR